MTPVAVVTGAGSGIGRTSAIKLAEGTAVGSGDRQVYAFDAAGKAGCSGTTERNARRPFA